MRLLRGRVYRVDIGLDERKLLLVVSNNRRNIALGSALAVRLTTSDKPPIPSIVPLSPAEYPLSGAVVCDDLMEIWPDEAVNDVGALSPLAMAMVGEGLKAALDLH